MLRDTAKIWVTRRWHVYLIDICIRFHVCHCHPTISCLISLKFRIMVYLPGADSFMLLWKRSRLTDVIVLNTVCGIWRRKHRQTDRNRHMHRMDCFTWLHNGVQLQSDQFLVSNGFDDWTEAFSKACYRGRISSVVYLCDSRSRVYNRRTSGLSHKGDKIDASTVLSRLSYRRHKQEINQVPHIAVPSKKLCSAVVY